MTAVHFCRPHTVTFSLELTILLFLNVQPKKLNLFQRMWQGEACTVQWLSKFKSDLAAWWKTNFVISLLFATSFIAFESWAQGDSTGTQIGKLHLDENSIPNHHHSELFKLHIKFPLSGPRDLGNSFRGKTMLTFWHLSASPHFKNATAGQARHCYVLSLYL